MPPDLACGIESRMNAHLDSDSRLSIPVDGLPWSWHSLTVEHLEPLLPFVMAADPSGIEALYWKRDAFAWLDARPTPRGIVGVHCLAGLTLALFFYSVVQGRRLAVERLRWLELARPHRSLDALLVIIVEQARRFICDEVTIAGSAVTERFAKEALAERAETAGFVVDKGDWHLLL